VDAGRFCSKPCRLVGTGSVGRMMERATRPVSKLEIQTVKTSFRSKGRHGFTLIELLVVVSIIALLISILLPSLSRAKEQAKIVACEANISSVGKVLMIYILDLNKIPVYATGTNSWCSWAYGGWSGRNRAYWENEFGVPEYNVETAARPLSAYAAKSPISKEKDRLTPTEETPSYKCPSDRISAQWQWGNFGNETEAISAYNDVGTSYQMDWHWWEQAVLMAPIDKKSDTPYIAGVEGPKLWFGQLQRQASRFVALFEDPMDWGLGTGWPDSKGSQTMGFHGKFSRHVGFFLDGHADYSLKDTRHYHDSFENPPGPRHGFTAVMGSWTVVDETMTHTSGGRHG